MPRRHSAEEDDTELSFEDDGEAERSSSGSAATALGALDDTEDTARDNE